MGGGFWISAKRNGAQWRNNGSRDCPSSQLGDSQLRPPSANPFAGHSARPRWIPAATPQLTFSGILGFGSGPLQSLGEGRAANGLFLERLAGGTSFPVRGAALGEGGSRPLSAPRVSGLPLPCSRAVPGLRRYPGVMGVSVFLPFPPLHPGSQVVKSKRCGRRPTLTSRPRFAGRSLSLL